MIKNIVGPVARGNDFFDREEFVNLLWDRLESGNILLAAPRRFGKTSVMYRLLDNPRPGWKPIHIDVESVREPVNFIIALLNALMADQNIRKHLISGWKTIGGWIRGILDEFEVKGPWDVGLKIKLKTMIGPDWQDRGTALLQKLSDYDRGNRLLIIIDELPIMLHLFRDNEVPDPEVRAFLYWFRKLRTDPGIGLTNCRFLAGGSIGIEHSLSRLRAAATFNDFERIQLPELSKPIAEDFLERLLKSRRLSLSPDTCRRILKLIGAPIPYFIQLFVSEVANAKANGLEDIGPKRLEAIYQDRIIGEACRNYFREYYECLGRYYEKPLERAAKALLKEMALAQPEPVASGQLIAVFRKTLGEHAEDDDFTRLIGDLENDFYVRYSDERRGYAFASKILCDWWRRYHAF